MRKLGRRQKTLPNKKPQTGGRKEAKESPEDHRHEEVHEAPDREKTESKNKTTADGLVRLSV